jgi:ferritin-like metal-binding protein YciE
MQPESSLTGQDYDGSLLDAALIGAAQRVEHYEIAAYGTVRSFAELLGENDQVSLLEETLQEEKETDERLTDLAKQINSEANGGGAEAKVPQSKDDRKKPKRVA